jgi:hypothetical protein
MAAQNPFGFPHLALASSISVAQAQRYGRSKRTIRAWCQQAPIGVRIAPGPSAKIRAGTGNPP